MSDKESNETKPTAVSAATAPAPLDSKPQPTASKIEVPSAPQVVPKSGFLSSAYHKAQSVAAAGKSFIAGHLSAEIVETKVEKKDGTTKDTKVLQVSEEIPKQEPDKPKPTQLGEGDEESCLLFPSYATKQCPEEESQEEGIWYIKIKGWAFSGGHITTTETILLDATRHVAGVASDSESSKILEQNASYFFATSVKNTPFTIESLGLMDVDKMEISGTYDDSKNFLEHLKEDRSSNVINSGAGHFEGILKVPVSKLDKLAKDRGTKLLKIQAIQDNLSKPSFGVITLVDDVEGVSIISDIDDTIKATGILDGVKNVLEKTFLHAPAPVSGMSDVYRRFNHVGVPLHYVSNGPWQLFPMLSAFFRESSFPPGSAHLRMFDMHTARAVPGQHKLTVIPELMRDFPKRKFILIGDTGELDPEVYTKIARLYPDRVLKIFIHDVTTEKVQHLPPLPHRHYTIKVLEGKMEHILHLIKPKDESNEGLDIAEETDADIFKTPLEVFHERIEKLTEGLPPTLFTLFTDPNTILGDPSVKNALPSL